MTPTAAATARPDLQELALEAWEPTKSTLHLGPDRRQGPLRWYCGKQSPVHLFWHGFDVAVTRFSGRRAPARDGADPSLVRPPPTRSSRSASGR